MPLAQEEEAGESAQKVRNGSMEMHDLSHLCCIKSKGAPQPHPGRAPKLLRPGRMFRGRWEVTIKVIGKRETKIKSRKNGKRFK